MKLIGTILLNNSAWAVYSEMSRTVEEEIGESHMLDEEIGQGIVFGPGVRLVAVTDEAAAEVLPLDLSPSLEKE